MRRSTCAACVSHGAYADRCSSEDVNEKTPIPPPDWEALIEQIASEIVAEHSPARILQVRAKLYDLLTHCIPPTTILKVWVRWTLLLDEKLTAPRPSRSS